MNLPKRDELLLRSVRAFPKASSSGFEASTCSATRLVSPDLETKARYCIITFTDSVFPAPDSPDTRMLWLSCLPSADAARIRWYPSSAIA